MIAVVAQDATLFDGSVADNLRLGRPDASDADMIAAARAANAHDFISALPDGYATRIGEREPCCRAASASVSRLPVRCCAMRRSCCSTRRCRRSTRRTKR